MRELSAEARPHIDARTVPSQPAGRLATFAVYSSFALIAAILFGTLSVHPF